MSPFHSHHCAYVYPCDITFSMHIQIQANTTNRLPNLLSSASYNAWAPPDSHPLWYTLVCYAYSKCTYMYDPHYYAYVFQLGSHQEHFELNVLIPYTKPVKKTSCHTCFPLPLDARAPPDSSTTLVHLDLLIPNAHYTRELPYCAYSFQLRSLQTF